MGTNKNGKRLYQVKIKGLDVTNLKELGRLMGPLQRQAFRKVYGKILDLIAAEVFTEAVVSLTQYYDQLLRCFTFGDFQIVPTAEEFEEILGCPLGGRKPYLFSGFLPSLSKIATVVGDLARELDRMKQTRNGVVGLPRKNLEGKARDMARQEEWVPFADILALLIFGVVLFPNVDGLVDLAAIDAFLAYHHSKESPVVAILVREEQRTNRLLLTRSFCVVGFTPIPTRHKTPVSASKLSLVRRKEKSRLGPILGWDRRRHNQLVSSMEGRKGGSSLLMWGLPKRYPMRGAPTEESLSPFLVRDFGAQTLKVVQRVHKVWKSPLKKDKELRGIRNGIIGEFIHEEKSVPSYERKTRLLQEPLNKKPRGPARKSMAETNSEVLCGVATMSSSSGERKETSHGSKRGLAQHLEAMERSMLAIIEQYKEELNQSLIHEQKLVEDFAQAYAEKETRGRAMLKLQKTIEDNATAVASNTTREAEPVLQPAINLGRDRNMMVFGRRYSPQAYPYGLPPDFTPPTAPDDLSQAPTFEGQLPPHADYPLQEDDEGDAHLGPLLPLKDPAPHELPQPNIVRHIRARSSLPTQVKGPPATEKMPAQHTAPATPRPTNNTTPGASYNNARRPPKDEFSPIPWHTPSLAIPGKVFQPPYPKWYNSNAKCAYHSGAPGHNIDSCLPLKYKVQHLINAGWLSFQEEGPNIKTNPLASHGGASINAIEKDGPSGANRLEDVATSRRFIYQSLQAICMVSHGGDEKDECLFHLGESHDMETCPVVEELLQRLMDWGQLEVSKGDREEPQICMQSEEKKVPPTPKALVICFTRNVTGSRPMYPPTAPKPTPGNPYKYGLGYEPEMPGRRNAPSRLWADRAWPDHVSQCFTSAGIMFEEEVAAIGDESPQDPPSFVRPCHPDSQVGNWRVISQSEVYTDDSIYEGRFFEDPNNEGLIIDFDREGFPSAVIVLSRFFKRREHGLRL
ncbi:hypothetical protein HKD37_20G056302 [Glycine soja]